LLVVVVWICWCRVVGSVGWDRFWVAQARRHCIWVMFEALLMARDSKLEVLARP